MAWSLPPSFNESMLYLNILPSILGTSFWAENGCITFLRQKDLESSVFDGVPDLENDFLGYNFDGDVNRLLKCTS